MLFNAQKIFEKDMNSIKTILKSLECYYKDSFKINKSTSFTSIKNHSKDI